VSARGGRRDYGWSHVEADLAMGVAPAVVAARLGESEDYILEIADRQGWPVTWKGPSSSDRRIANHWLDS
jgi:hypothetical protein